MGQKRKKPETPKHSNFMSWITTPPLRKFQGLKKRKESTSSPSTTSLIDPSPILQRKTRNLIPLIEKREFLQVLDSFNFSLKKQPLINATPLELSRTKKYSEDDIESGYVRYIILEKTTLENELQLRLLDQTKMQECSLKISGKWLEISIKVGKIINVLIDDQNDASWLEVNDQNGIFVLDPDELLSATSVSDSYVCTRRSILKEKIKYSGTSNQSMVNGNLVHELFQEAVRSGDFTYDFLTTKLNILIKNSIEEIYSVGISDVQTYEELKKFIPMIQEWHAKYYSPGELTMIKPLEIEERIWSYKLGLKGFIDVTAQIQTETLRIIPLELKTGKNKQMSHRAQTQLYTMMIKDKYKVDVDFGLLVYLQEKDPETRKVYVPREELVYLMVNRNLMAGYLAKSFVLPRLTDNYSDCERCYMNNECMIYNKVFKYFTRYWRVVVLVILKDSGVSILKRRNI
jgi:DNA replication ATP-dependent helicase Dna2